MALERVERARAARVGEAEPCGYVLRLDARMRWLLISRRATASISGA